MRTQYYVVFCLLGIVFFCAIGFMGYKQHKTGIAQKIRKTPVGQRAAIISYYREFGGLHIQSGMSKQQIERIVGLPQNSDNQYVWAWSFNYQEHNSHNDRTWVDMLDDGIIYVVFLDNCIIGKELCIEVSAVATPIEYIMSIKGCNEMEALSLLGLHGND